VLNKNFIHQFNCQAILILNSEYGIAKCLLPIGGFFSAIEEESTVPALPPPHHEEQKESEKSDAAAQAQDTNKDDEKKTRQSSQENSFEDYRSGLIKINKSYRGSKDYKSKQVWFHNNLQFTF
jgi:hypothetical protein